MSVLWKSFHWLPITLIIIAQVLIMAYKALQDWFFIVSVTFSPTAPPHPRIQVQPDWPPFCSLNKPGILPTQSLEMEALLFTLPVMFFPPDIHMPFPLYLLGGWWNVTFTLKSFLTNPFKNVAPNPALPLFLPFFKFLHVTISHLTHLYLVVYHLSCTKIWTLWVWIFLSVSFTILSPASRTVLGTN